MAQQEKQKKADEKARIYEEDMQKCVLKAKGKHAL